MVQGQLPGSSATAPRQGLVAGDGGAYGQVAACNGSSCSRLLCLSQRLWRVGGSARPVPVAAPPDTGSELSSLFPQPHTIAVITPSVRVRIRQGKASHTRPPWGMAHQDETTGGERSARPVALAPLHADGRGTPSQFPGTPSRRYQGARQEPHTHDPGGSHPRMGVHLCTPTAVRATRSHAPKRCSCQWRVDPRVKGTP